MLILNKDNILDYIKNKTDLIDEDIIKISEIGEGNPDEDGDGYVNFIYKISCKNKSFIIKQARPYIKTIGTKSKVPVTRNRLEYETFKLRASIVPEYVPEIYYQDIDNNIFIMEDVSYLKILRFQLCKMRPFYNFPKQCAEYLASSNFYTSELFLDTEMYRSLLSSFMNSEMRSIMENVAFIRGHFELDYLSADKDLIHISEFIWSDKKVILECYKLRDIFMKNCECLIHGDLHTSNIFIGPDDMKIIDMEYTFMGPASYDMGYLLGNFISQYSATSFKVHEDSLHIKKFKSYLLSAMKELYHFYLFYFNSYFDKDAKAEYKNVCGYKEYLSLKFLHEMLGFAATANINRITSFAAFPDFDVISNETCRNNARALSLLISRHIILNRTNYNNMDDVINDMIKIEITYKNQIKSM